MVRSGPEENLTNNLCILQQLVQNFEQVISSLDAQDILLKTWIDRLEKIILPILETSPSGDPLHSREKDSDFHHFEVTAEIEALEKLFLSFTSYYQKFLHICERPGSSNPFQSDKEAESDLPHHPVIKKISLFLIHEDIFTLTTLIHYYTHFEYFTVYPFFSVSHLLADIHPETDGLILISSGIIKEDPLAFLTNIRNHTLLMPILVMKEEDGASDTQPYIEAGYNGTIRKECQISELLNLFLTGLRDQATVHSDIHGG